MNPTQRFINKAHALAALAHFTRLPSLARSSPPELKATAKTPSPHSACCQIVLRLRRRITRTSRLPDLLLSPWPQVLIGCAVLYQPLHYHPLSQRHMQFPKLQKLYTEQPCDSVLQLDATNSLTAICLMVKCKAVYTVYSLDTGLDCWEWAADECNQVGEGRCTEWAVENDLGQVKKWGACAV